MADGRLKPDLCDFAFQRLFGCLVEFAQKLLKRNSMQASEPSDRLSRTCWTAITFKPILVKHLSGLKIPRHDLRQQHIWRNEQVIKSAFAIARHVSSFFNSAINIVRKLKIWQIFGDFFGLWKFGSPLTFNGTVVHLNDGMRALLKGNICEKGFPLAPIPTRHRRESL